MTDAPLSHAQRLHDLRGAHANFKSVLRLIESGYRFDDEDAPAALAQLDKAVKLLDREIRALESEWKAKNG
jgi:hypothetical protein